MIKSNLIQFILQLPDIIEQLLEVRCNIFGLLYRWAGDRVQQVPTGITCDGWTSGSQSSGLNMY